eukprot:15560824-Heterocapsa_arctica.AAC.1
MAYITIVNDIVPSEEVKWQRDLSRKMFQPNYKYNIHLGTFLVCEAQKQNNVYSHIAWNTGNKICIGNSMRNG